MMRFYKILSSKAAIVFFDQVLYSGTNFILTFFLAKNMNLTDFGLFSTIVVFTFLALSAINALIIQPFQVSIVQIAEKNQYYVFLFSALLIVLLFFLASSLLVNFYLPSKTFNIIEAALFIAAYIFQDFFRKLFLGLNKVLWVLVIDGLFLLLVILGFYATVNNLNLSISLLVIALANISSGAIGLVFILQVFEFPYKWKIFLNQHVQQAKWLLSVAGLQWASSNFFILISGIYIGLEALGALRLVQSFFGILNVVLQTVENYYLPKIATLYHNNIPKAKRYLLKISTFGALFFGIILTILFVFSSRIIVLAAGPSFEKYAFLVQIMAVLYFFIFISYPVRIVIRVLVLNKVFFFGYLISFIVSLLSFHVLLDFLGLSGAVLGLIINQIVMLLYWQNQLKKNDFSLWK